MEREREEGKKGRGNGKGLEQIEPIFPLIPPSCPQHSSSSIHVLLSFIEREKNRGEREGRRLSICSSTLSLSLSVCVCVCSVDR
jgi:hypothetical protein